MRVPLHDDAQVSFPSMRRSYRRVTAVISFTTRQAFFVRVTILVGVQIIEALRMASIYVYISR